MSVCCVFAFSLTCCSLVAKTFCNPMTASQRASCPSQSPGVCSNSCPLSPWCHPTMSSSLAASPPALNLSQHQVLFQWADSLHLGPNYWSFRFSISSSSEYSGLISFSIDWFGLLQNPCPRELPISETVYLPTTIFSFSEMPLLRAIKYA